MIDPQFQEKNVNIMKKNVRFYNNYVSAEQGTGTAAHGRRRKSRSFFLRRVRAGAGKACGCTLYQRAPRGGAAAISVPCLAKNPYFS